MLKRKMFRDIRNNLSQFITIFLMVLIGVMVYTGIEAYMDGMIDTADRFYTNNNLQDLNVMGNNFNEEDILKIKNIENVKNAERKLVINAIDANNLDKSYLVSFIESNNISKFYVVDGIEFDATKKGVWLDEFYAIENNLKVGDIIRIKYDTFVLEEKILGLINVPDHLYDIQDSSQLMPNREKNGFVYLSINELPESYIKELVMKEMNIEGNINFERNIQDFDYKKYIPYNYIMVDVNEKENVDNVKNKIEETLENELAVIKIEDTLSYSSYQGEIDEGRAFIGVFSGLFLFIAMLSVITTMTRVVKKQRIQIGTLKALGFNNRKIIIHYISYGFWISLFGAIFGMIAGRYFIGSVFFDLQMTYFEIPEGKPIVSLGSYIVSICVVMCVSIITYIACRKELIKSPVELLRNELPKVKSKTLNITSKGIFNKMKFSSKWNLRDILRNRFRTITGIIGIAGCCMLIVCAIGMLNSMNNFIKLQFEELYNFDYKLTLKSNLNDEEINELIDKYGNSTSQSIGIEILDKNNNKESNNIFVYDASEYIRFHDNKNKFIKIDNNKGIYVTYKLAETNGYKIGDKIKWRIYGEDIYYESEIVGFNKDPQNQNITITKEYLESLNIKYKPDTIYTNIDLNNVNEIKNVEIIQDISTLEKNIVEMLFMMKTLIKIIIIFAIILAIVIIYNMGILSFSEKQYQFATLKVLGFNNNKIKKIYIKQNNWLTIIAIIIGLPIGYYLIDWLFTACLGDNYDFSVKINISTYIIAILGTYFVSYIVSKLLSKKINKIDMVKSLKANE